MGLVNGFHKVTHVKDSKISGGHSVVEKCPVCDYKAPQDGGRVNSCLDCFCKGEKIYIIRYKVALQYSSAEEDLKSGKIHRGYRNNDLYLSKHLFLSVNVFFIFPRKKSIESVQLGVEKFSFYNVKKRRKKKTL
ncbi:hypothetical protein QQ045_013455 [Rhodiola kirilowii]